MVISRWCFDRPVCPGLQGKHSHLFTSETVVDVSLYLIKGEAPADAPETRAIAGFINYLAQTPAGAKMYTDWHSYSQLFMFRKCSKVQ